MGRATFIVRTMAIECLCKTRTILTPTCRIAVTVIGIEVATMLVLETPFVRFAWMPTNRFVVI
jgi:hypothetical protein